MTRTRLVGLGSLWLLAAAPACLTLDPFFFTNEASDGYGWDDDPCDPQLLGEIAEVTHARKGGPPPTCHPSRITADARHEGLLDVDGRDVHYVFAQHPDPVATIFYSHGRSKHLARYWDRVELMVELGYSVMIYDYPGYGRSQGEPDEAGMYANAQAVLERLAEMPGVDPDDVVFFGYSLGGGPTYEMAVRALAGETTLVPRAVISESAFCSTATLVQDGAYVDLPVEFVANNRFDNCAAMETVAAQLPVLILHGDADTFLLPVHAEKLQAASGDRATLVWIDGADHEELPVIGGANYVDTITEFIGGE